MKVIAALLISLLMLGPDTATACGTNPPEIQSKIDATDLAELRALATATARDADQIFIGTVTDLSRPVRQSGEFGSVTFDVKETLKGAVSPRMTARWKDNVIYSCQASKMFHNVGFRPGGTFIVYLRNGQIFRSGAADDLRSSLLSLAEEHATAAASGSR